MMFSTIRSRLWLGYTVLVLVIISAFVVGLTVTLTRSPVLYRQTILQMRLAEQTVVKLIENGAGDTVTIIRAGIAKRPLNNDIRILVLDSSGATLFDSQAGQKAAIRLLSLLGIRRTETLDNTGTIRDENRKVWLYVGRKLEDGEYLVIAAPRGNLSLRIMFSDPMIRTFFRVFLLSILTSFILALLMNRWIADPIRRVSQSAGTLALIDHKGIPVQGPDEVKELAKSLNEMSKQIRDSQQAQKDFISDVSHELKTPLTSIQGFSQAIIDGTASDPDSVKHSARVIHSESGRMLALVTDLLTLTRFEGAVEKSETELVNLESIFVNVKERLSIIAVKSEVGISGNLSLLPKVHAHAERILQVMMNLVENAVKYSRPGSEVQVTGEADQKWVRVNVTDHGPGISEADLPRIFDRFYQVEKSRNNSITRSTGLGLPIARQIARYYGGEVTVRSELGVGSVFTLSMPINFAEPANGDTKPK